MDHHAAVRSALNLLKPRLEAFIHSRLKATYGAAYLSREPRLRQRPDTQALLSIIIDQWPRCFSGVLKPSERSIAHELKAARNLWAHEEEISWDQAYRCADNVQLLLHAIGANDAGTELERLKRSLRNGDSPVSVRQDPAGKQKMDSASVDAAYPSFAEFMAKAVLPHRDRDPSAERLDGERSGGNRKVFGRFWHAGRLWRVNSDTHFEPLLLAYRHLDAEPLVEAQTSSGAALVLRPELQASRGTTHKHLYIYAEESSASGARSERRPAASSAVGTAARGRDLVAEQLRRRGVDVAELKSGNRYVLEIRHPENGRRIHLRTKSKRSGTWQGRASDGDPDPTAALPETFWVFVDLGAEPPQFHIIPDQWIRRNIYEFHQAYLERYGGRRAVTQDSDHHAIQPARIRPWRDRWDLLGL